MKTALLWLLPFAAKLHADTVGSWQAVDLLSDEFNGTDVDPGKWKRGNPQWDGHPPGLFKDGNVHVRDGRLRITMKSESGTAGDGTARTISCGSLASRARIRYGKFESSVKAMPSAGSSAFWLFNHEPTQWTELDICELCGAGEKFYGKVHMNAHSFFSPASPEHHQIPAVHETGKDLCAAFHTYGMEWSQEHVSWYLDGTMIRRMPNTHWHQPLYVILDSNTLSDWFGIPPAASLPSTMEVEYVRVWQWSAARAAAPSAPAVPPPAPSGDPPSGKPAPAPHGSDSNSGHSAKSLQLLIDPATLKPALPAAKPE